MKRKWCLGDLSQRFRLVWSLGKMLKKKKARKETMPRINIGCYLCWVALAPVAFLGFFVMCFNNSVIGERKSPLTLGSRGHAPPRIQGKWNIYSLVMWFCTFIWCSQGYFQSWDLLLNLSSTGDGTEYRGFNFLWSPRIVGEFVVCELTDWCPLGFPR